MKQKGFMAPLIIAIIILLIIGVFYFVNKKEAIAPAIFPPVVTDTNLAEKVNVENYLRANISKLSPVKAVLGGTWYVVSLTVDLVKNSGTVVYEDGHIQETKNFSYTTNEKGEIVSLTIVSKTDISPLDSGVEGIVALGPTCPVMRNPPDPTCADKPYSTTIQVINIGSPRSSPFTTVTSDKEGKYKIMLPPGEYALQPIGGSVMPRCETKNIKIEPVKVINVNLSCDTGIR